MKNSKGKVWLVGAGPGDKGLFTIKGRNVLKIAEVVVYDKLVGQGILSMIPKGTEKIFVGKISGNHLVPQEQINKILLEEALKGKQVVRLKGGDPFVFGRGGEELELLVEHQVPFEIVPGITSAVAVPAYNGIPVTHRDFTSSLHIITGHTKKSKDGEMDYEALVRLEGTLVFLMSVSSMKNICAKLVKAGMDKNMPAAILERGTSAHQKRVVADISTLSEEAEKAEIKAPAIIVVGKVCALEKDFAWAEKRALGGLKIAVTRPRDRDSYLAEKLAFLGAEIVILPTIETKELENNQLLKDVILNIFEFGWILFTSPVAVEIFFKELMSMKRDIRQLGNVKFAAIGMATRSAIEKRGILVDLMPERYSGEALGNLIAEQVIGEKNSSGATSKILIPRAKIGAEEILEAMEKKGVQYVDLPIYETQNLEAEGELETDLDFAAFTSASTVQGFVRAYEGTEINGVKAICIGESTAKEARKSGMKVFVAKEATMDSMIDCLLDIC